MQISTVQFGVLTFEEDAVFTFPKGILGFPQLTRYLLMEEPDHAPLRWLQSIEQPEIAFAVIDPRLFFEDYRVPLQAEDREMLGMASDELPVPLAIVTIPRDPRQMTANLQGPVVLAAGSHRGMQIVLNNSPYALRQRLLPDATPAMV